MSTTVLTILIKTLKASGDPDLIKAAHFVSKALQKKLSEE